MQLRKVAILRQARVSEKELILMHFIGDLLMLGSKVRMVIERAVFVAAVRLRAFNRVSDDELDVGEVHVLLKTSEVVHVAKQLCD